MTPTGPIPMRGGVPTTAMVEAYLAGPPGEAARDLFVAAAEV